jgi:hypothetical protein
MPLQRLRMALKGVKSAFQGSTQRLIFKSEGLDMGKGVLDCCGVCRTGFQVGLER